MNQLQVTEVLKVLKNIQTCIRNKDTYIPGVGDLYNQDENYRSPFNLGVSASICWHVYAHTNGGLGIDMDFLKPVFVELGYNADYPVENTFMPNQSHPQYIHYRYYVNPYNLYWGTDDKGDLRPDCPIRCKLVDQLVQYFETKLLQF